MGEPLFQAHKTYHKNTSQVNTNAPDIKAESISILFDKIENCTNGGIVDFRILTNIVNCVRYISTICLKILNDANLYVKIFRELFMKRNEG